MPKPGISDERREAIAAWLTANHISPKDVPLNAQISTHKTANGDVIRYEAYVRDKNGRLQATDGYKADRETRETPLIAAPPADWPA